MEDMWQDDSRIPLEKGDYITVENSLYEVENLITSGGQALLYRCKEVAFEKKIKKVVGTTDFCIKEYYPEGALRAEKTLRINEEIEVLCKYVKPFDDEQWKQHQAQIAKVRDLAANIRTKTHLANYLPIKVDKENLTECSLYVPENCSTITKLLNTGMRTLFREDEPYSDLLRLKKSVEIIDSLMESLIDFHEEALSLHRDLTPSNVFWAKNKDGTGVALPVDFACSVKIGACEVFSLPRSPGYSNPTLLDADTSIQGDLYSLGALLLVLATGKACVDTDWVVSDLTYAYNIKEPVGQKNLPYGVKSKLIDVISRSTTADMAKPYESVREMREDIKTLLEVINGNGVHPETLLDGSRAMLQKLQKKELDPELFPDVVDIGAPPISKYILLPHPKSKIPIPVVQRIYPNIAESIGVENCLLIGEGGCGKTSRLFREWSEFLEKAEHDCNRFHCIPLYIELHGFNGSQYYIRDYILKRYIHGTKADGGDREKLEQLFETGRYLLLLDGVNECINSSHLGEEIVNLTKLNGVKVCIASRYKPAWEWLNSYKTFTTQKLTIKTVRDKLLQNGFKIPSSRLEEVLRQPMLLANYLKLDQNTAVCNAGQILYESIERVVKRPGELGKGGAQQIIREFAAEVALPLLAHLVDRLVFTFDEADRIFEQDSKNFNNTMFKRLVAYWGTCFTEHVLNTLLDIGIIAVDSKTGYRFVHGNYKDLFHALYWKYQIQNGIFPDKEITAVMRYLGDLLGESNGDGKSVIEEILKVKLANKHDHKSQMAIKIMVDVMKLARQKNLSVCFDNLDLTLVDFDGCDLQGASFAGSTISDTSFGVNYDQQISIAFVDNTRVARQMSGCPVEVLDIKSGDKMILPAPSDGCYSRLDGEYYLRGCETGTLEVWSLIDGTYVATFESNSDVDNGEYYPGNVCKYFVQAKYVPEYQRLVCVMPDGFIRVYNQKTGGWKELTCGSGAVFDDAKHFINPVPGKAYPIANPEPENCIVVNDRIISVPRGVRKSQNDTLFVWNLNGERIHTEKFSTEGGIYLTKVLSSTNGHCCLIVSRMSSSKHVPEKFQKKWMIRCWDVKNNCFHPYKNGWISDEDEINLYAVSEEYLIQGSIIDELNSWTCIDNGDGNFCIFEGSGLRWYVESTEYEGITQFACSKKGDTVALAYRSGTVIIHKENEETPIVWQGMSVKNVCGCDFSGAIISEELRKALKQCGAVVD